MALVEDGDGRSANVELNLIPFIDLMSVCITFLLITAVWAQVSMIQIGSSVYGKKREGDPLPEMKMDNVVVLRIDIIDQGYRVNFDTRSFLIPRQGTNQDDGALLEELQRIKVSVPDKMDATITVLDQLPYDELIRAMDQTLMAGFPEISVAAGGGGA